MHFMSKDLDIYLNKNGDISSIRDLKSCLNDFSNISNLSNIVTELNCFKNTENLIRINSLLQIVGVVFIVQLQ